VVSSIAPNRDGTGLLNVNADAAAAALAVALRAEKLVLMTDVAGLYANWPETDSLISTITANGVDRVDAPPRERDDSQNVGLPRCSDWGSAQSSHY
jgi:acetylglutamate kinase